MASDRTDDWRIALHEAVHALVGVMVGFEIEGVTCDPRDGASGMCWGPQGGLSNFSDAHAVEIAGQLRMMMPCDGDVRDADTAKIYQHVICCLVQTAAGSEAEFLHFGMC
jgi:hypothetical protein